MIGVDANAAAMREAARTAARSPRKGGLPNAVFVVSAIEAISHELTAIADDVRIVFPWGSLLRGVVGADMAVLAGVGRIAAPGATIRAFVSVTERDGLDITPDVDRAAYEAHGLRLIEARDATRDEITETNSSWAKRLRAGIDRPVTLIRAVRQGTGS